MDNTQVWPFIVAIAVIVAGVLLIAFLRHVGSRKPGSRIVINVLTPYIYQAIVAAQIYANGAIDQAQERLNGTDKKQIANAFYDFLPRVIFIGPVPLPIGFVKAWISRERFAELIQAVYSKVNVFVDGHQDHFRETLKRFATHVGGAHTMSDSIIAVEPVVGLDVMVPVIPLADALGE